VPAREVRRVAAPADRPGAVVHLDRALVDVVAARYHHAALAGGDDLVELEAEPGSVAEGAEPLAPEGGAGGLADVLDEGDAAAAGELDQRAHVGRVPAHVHGEDRPG